MGRCGASPRVVPQASGPGLAGRIRARIKPNIVFADSVAGNAIATVEVRLASDGTIVSRRLVKGSGLRVRVVVSPRRSPSAPCHNARLAV